MMFKVLQLYMVAHFLVRKWK